MAVGVPCAMNAVSKAFGAPLGGPLGRTASGAGLGAVDAGTPAKEGSVTDPQPPSIIAETTAKTGSHERCMLSLPPMRVAASPPPSRRLPPAPAPMSCQAIRPKACKRCHRSDALGKATPTAPATARRSAARAKTPHRRNAGSSRPVRANHRCGLSTAREDQHRTYPGDARKSHHRGMVPSCHHAAALGEVVPIAFAGAGRLELAQLARHLFVLAPGGIKFGAQIGDRIEQVPAPQRGGLGKS